MSLEILKTLTRAEVETVVAAGREAVQEMLSELRTIRGSEQARSARRTADELTELGRELLGLAPDLTAWRLPMAMDLSQIAHALYGDHTRRGEILELNPGLAAALPLIKAGTEITVYVS